MGSLGDGLRTGERGCSVFGGGVIGVRGRLAGSIVSVDAEGTTVGGSLTASSDGINSPCFRVMGARVVVLPKANDEVDLLIC